MVQQVTNGIKISVKTKFEGMSNQNRRLLFTFSYEITIENQSNASVQLMSRHWKIFDSLKSLEIVEGEGVIGKKPVLAPKKSYTYSSYCNLTSPTGAMKGFFNMINFTNTNRFKVNIPSFQLTVPAVLN
ncbi:Co2+/Mg2+ efflux protein ApaG [Aureibaculum algae]|uniref:Co2+/Mg2+ efflux protein ApaG n=2 Tax=Aureibaculum TaxID=2706948 RepID=A0A5B7TVH2_9FLAO|nr:MULTISPECIES: Co2+/Mg2+ efflux protein ApaG [Aureibaculum]MBJ2174886.1 Co2+/Mg2+ efflux protein ApaG [Aureibaculum flavum]QCX40248.1 Co2+/Mg2+ efflux protein ApaG [Aureibaculum algae]